MTLTISQIEELEQIVDAAISKIYEDDPELIEKSGMERSAAFRFGLYFYCLTRKIDWLSSLDIDMEYNKIKGQNIKPTQRRPAGTQPDFILHKRDDDTNILVIEFKHWSNPEDREPDIKKLEDFVNQNDSYKYGLGIFIELGKEKGDCEPFLDYEPEN